MQEGMKFFSHAGDTAHLTNTEGGDFVHEGTGLDGEPCPRGRILQKVDDNGNITYECAKCGRTWKNGKLGV